MGFISLPNLDDIAQMKDPNQKIEALINTVGILMKELSELNGHMDSKNIRANSITAQKMDVEELSAITANMGKLTSGEIYGAYIATAEGAFPRAELDSTNNLFAAMATAQKYLKISSIGTGNVPTIEFRDLAAALSAFIDLGTHLSIQSNGRFDLKAATNLFVSATTIILLNTTRIKFTDLIDDPNNTTLASQLSAKANGSGISGTVYVATTAGGAANTAITFSNGVRTS